MHEKSPTLSAQRRERIGSRYAKRDRDAGKLPAIVYGHGETPVPITLDRKDALIHFVKGEKVFELALDGKNQYVLLKDLGYDHLGTNIIHADFARVNLDERVNTKAHLHLVGTPLGLKKAGAVLIKPITELELNCTVTTIPESIEVDISELDVGHALHAGDVKLPAGSMKLLTDTDAVIAQIVIQGEIAVSAEAGEAGATAAEPVVITEKKKDAEVKG